MIGYHIESRLEDVLKSEYHKSSLGYNNVDWFVNEDIKFENKMAFYFKNTKKDIIMTKEDKKDFKNNSICRFCEKNIESDKIRDHCHLTGIYREPAHSKCNIKVTQDKSNFIPIIFHNFSNYDCQIFFRKLVDKKKDKVEFYNIPNTNEEYISVTYGCNRFFDNYRFLSSSLDALVKTLVDNSHKTSKDFREEFIDNDEVLKNVNEIVEEIKTIKDFKKDHPDEIENLKEALHNCIGDNDLLNFKNRIS